MTYELVYIIPAQFTEGELPGIQAKVAGLVEVAGAKIVADKNVGRLKFAYPVKGGRYGHYFQVNFEADTQVLPKLNEALRLSSDLVRFQISASTKVGKEPAKIIGFDDAKMRPREDRGVLPPGKAAVAAAVEAAPVQESATTSGLSMEDLDKKLDQILNEKVD